MDIPVTAEDVIGEYRQQLSEAHHQLAMSNITIRKLTDRVKQLEAQRGPQAAQNGYPPMPGQLAPPEGLNGHSGAAGGRDVN